MIDLDKFVDALQLTWVKRFFNNKGPQWAILAEYNIGNHKKFIEMATVASKTEGQYYKPVLL